MKQKRKALLAGASSLLMLVALAIPFLVHARSVDARISCISNLRHITGAKVLWAQQRHKGDNDVPSWADILSTMYPGRKAPPFDFVCRKGGVYIIGRAGEPSRCSFPGHELPQLCAQPDAPREPGPASSDR